MSTRADHRTTAPDDLLTRLERAPDHRSASEAVVAELADAHGTYSQVFDGMPPSAGVIGRTFTSGTTAWVEDVAGNVDYLEIASEVVAQVCVPMRGTDGHVIGVLNAESHRALDSGVVAHVEAAAAALATRLAQVGGALVETPAQRLVRHAARLTEAHDPVRLQHELLTAAIDIAGLDSAALAVRGADGTTGVSAAAGPLEALLQGCPPSELARAADYVAAGCSCVTVVDEPAAEPEVLPSVRRRGVVSAAVLGLTEQPSRMLIVASTDRRPIATETVELLELLCAQAKSVWRSCDLLADLRHQAATDPLTGLAHHGAFYERLRTAAPGGVAMLDLDHFKAYNDARGHPAGDALLREVADVLRSTTRSADELFRVGGDEFAVLVADPQTDALAQVAGRIEQALRARTGATISIGVALGDPVEALPDTRKRADAALYAAKADGRGRIVVAS